ncbi:MAG TPA: hypothetical protein VF503_28125 [Sphingobium sp.]|uniref:hypothetical protein n=1 Tax=Sphingobium sp. TaxID=1912891 RepID=UPI002ED5C1C9
MVGALICRSGQRGTGNMVKMIGDEFMRMNSKSMVAGLGVLAMLLPVQALQAQASAAAPAAAPAKKPVYSTGKTQLGTLMADPAAKAVLEKHIPQLLTGGQNLDQASGMTLRELQDAVKAYAPDQFSNKVLDAIDKDLAALPGTQG